MHAACVLGMAALQEAERTKLQERLGRWKVEMLQQLLDILDLPTPSRGTKVCVCRGSWGMGHVC